MEVVLKPTTPLKTNIFIFQGFAHEFMKTYFYQTPSVRQKTAEWCFAKIAFLENCSAVCLFSASILQILLKNKYIFQLPLSISCLLLEVQNTITSHKDVYINCAVASKRISVKHSENYCFM